MAFSVPSVENIKECNKIRAESKPSLFQSKHQGRSVKHTSSENVNVERILNAKPSASPSASLSETAAASYPSTKAQTSDQERQQTAELTPYQPHAIIANPLQVGAHVEYLLFGNLLLSPSLICHLCFSMSLLSPP